MHYANTRNAKGLISLLVFLFISCLIPTQSLHAASSTGTAMANVNIRKQPSLHAPIIAKVKQGTLLTIQKKDKDWVQVVYQKQVGYVIGTLLSQNRQSAVKTTSWIVTTKTSAKLRTGAGTQYSVLCSVSPKVSLKAIQKQSNWVEVNYHGKVGFIRQDLLLENVGQTTQRMSSTSGTTMSVINLRKEANISSDILAVISPDSSLVITGTNGDWYSVRFAAKQGYVKKQYVQIKSSNKKFNQISYGSSGNEIKTLQNNLHIVGLYQGPANGKFGPVTQNAVISFQEKNGLKVDGVVGAKTLELLNKQAVSIKASKPSVIYSSLQKGANGRAVILLQNALREKGVYQGKSDGKFGSMTAKAVSAYQKSVGLPQNGVADNATQTKLYSKPVPAKALSSIPGFEIAPGGVEVFEWFSSPFLMPVNKNMTVYDVRTGKTFTMQRFSGANHADVEPLTIADTQMMFELWGNKWSWDTRPIWVTFTDRNGKRRTWAGSLNGMPHAYGPNTQNNMDGQVCMHFLNSRTHNTNSVDKYHQASMKEAYDAAVKKGVVSQA